MTKKAKILILLTSISLVLVIYLIVSSKLVVVDKSGDKQTARSETKLVKQPVDLKVLTSKYEAETNMILSDLDKMIANYTSTSSQTLVLSETNSKIQTDNNEIKPSMLKTRLMNLTVPTEFKDSHIKLVLAVSKFEEYSKSQLDDDFNEGLELVKQAREMSKEIE